MIAAGHRIGVVTAGAVSSVGIGWEVMCAALRQGQSGIGPVQSFDVTLLRCKQAGEIHDFDAHAYLEGKPLRGMSRSAHLSCSAAALALGAPSDCARTASHRTGLVAGTAYGNVQSMVRFDRETFQEGPRFVDATLFPNTVINSPAGFTSIFFEMRGPNTTLTDGTASAFAALDYAAGLLRRGAADEVVAGGFEELSPWVYLGLHNAGKLAGSRPDRPETSAPFDTASTGFVLGEGAAFFRLLAAAELERRGAVPLAWLTGIGEAFVAPALDSGTFDRAAAHTAFTTSMRAALASAGLAPEDIGAVWASANGDPALDAIESRALGEVFGERLAQLPVVAVKAAIGECYGASGALQLATCLEVLRGGSPPAALLRGGATTASGRSPASHVLLNAFNGTGNNRSLVASRA